MKFEYAYFVIEAPCTEGFSGPECWPDMLVVNACIDKMNELGADGWEIVERIIGPLPLNTLLPCPAGVTRKIGLYCMRRAA
jgi:hypothetical protein